MRRYEISTTDKRLEALHLVERPEPKPGPGEVLVRMRAASLNLRDLGLVRPGFPEAAPPRDVVPLSDGAGEIAAIGSGVTRVKVGDRVVATFFQNWTYGPRRNGLVALGAGGVDGVLTEYMVLQEGGVLPIPECLSFEEAACLPCAGLTAWAALMENGKPLRVGETVLTLGTGGVSVLALQFAHAAGARVIVTSSSDEKLARAIALGAEIGINYKKVPEWGKEVLARTGGHGADHVIELGSGTLAQSFEAVAFGGKIALVGVYTGGMGDNTPFALIYKAASLQGIGVGSRVMFENMLAAIAASRIKPVIDKSFDFADAASAFAYLMSAKHFGKVVIRIG